MESWQPDVRSENFKDPTLGGDLKGRKPLHGSTGCMVGARPSSQWAGPVKAPPDRVLGLRVEGTEEALNMKGRQKKGRDLGIPRD